MSATSDDWRLRVGLHETGLVHALSQRLAAHKLEHELESNFADRVIVSIDGAELFCYAGAREPLEAARSLIDSIAREKGWQVDFELQHWHPEEEAWKDPSVPLPESGSQREAEHAARIAREREEAAAQGFPSFEVRVECATEEDCEQFAARLRSEGYQIVSRAKFVVVGAADEDSANELAGRLQREAPRDAAVMAEGTMPAIYAVTPRNPFAFFGGLGA